MVRSPIPHDPPAAVPTPSSDQPLSIVMVTSESHPFARSGGLAEVCAALPAALAARGHDITVVLPRFRGVETAGFPRVPVRFSMGAREVSVIVVERRLETGVLMAFVDAGELFDREGLYGSDHTDYPDNAWRFALLTRAALEYIRRRARRPAVFHAHDWQAGTLPVWQKLLYADDPVVGGVRTLFTIHNLAFQGLFPAGAAAEAGLPPAVLDVEAMEYWGGISYLKAGITFSDAVSTVSPTYAREILTPELGLGMDGVLRRRSETFVGILNGVDTGRWDPRTDRFLPRCYDVGSVAAGKAAARAALAESVGLGRDGGRRPLIGLLSRMTDQKGFDLIAAAEPTLMALDADWVLLGSGDERYERHWQALADAHPGRVAAVIGFEERLAHLIIAGADLFLMPSRFEPCGLNQLHSLRYGTVPVVRMTGGLADTVADADGDTGTGVVFEAYSPEALTGAVARGLALAADGDAWPRLQARGMQQDHSWDVSAREYVKVYGTPPH